MGGVFILMVLYVGGGEQNIQLLVTIIPSTCAIKVHFILMFIKSILASSVPKPTDLSS